MTASQLLFALGRLPHVRWRPHVSPSISRSNDLPTCAITPLPHYEKHNSGHSGLVQPSKYVKKAPFPDEPPRVMSKIWRLRYINWCMMCGDMCFVVHRADFSRSSLATTAGRQHKRTRRSHGCPSSWTALRPLALRWHRSCRPWRQTCRQIDERFFRLLLLMVGRKKREVGTLLFAPASLSKRTHKKNQDIQNTFAPHCALRANERCIALSFWAAPIESL